MDAARVDPPAPVPTGLPPNLVATLLMLTAFVSFTLMSILMRSVGTQVPLFEIIFMRQMIAFIILAPLFARHWQEVRRPRGMGLHLARGLLAIGSMACGLTAVVIMPLADVTAIQMAEVLLITALAAVILGEQIGWRRWTAAGVGFIGIGIMLRPFGGGFDTVGLLPLAGALFAAGGVIALRLGSARDRMETVLFWQGVIILAFAIPIAIWVWKPPTYEQWLLLIAMGIVYTAGQWLFTQATRMGEASALAPLQYVRLLMMAFIGWLIYDEIPTIWTGLGAMLVIGAATYTISRNAKRGSPTKAPQPSP